MGCRSVGPQARGRVSARGSPPGGTTTGCCDAPTAPSAVTIPSSATCTSPTSPSRHPAIRTQALCVDNVEPGYETAQAPGVLAGGRRPRARAPMPREPADGCRGRWVGCVACMPRPGLRPHANGLIGIIASADRPVRASWPSRAAASLTDRRLPSAHGRSGRSIMPGRAVTAPSGCCRCDLLADRSTTTGEPRRRRPAARLRSRPI